MIAVQLIYRRCKLCRQWFNQYPKPNRPVEYCGPCKRERYDTRAGRVRKQRALIHQLPPRRTGRAGEESLTMRKQMQRRAARDPRVT